MTPNTTISGNSIITNLNCDFTVINPNCSIPTSLTLPTNTPMLYNFNLIINSSSQIITIPIDNHYLLELQNINYVNSWILNSNSAGTFKIVLSTNLNPNFNWYYLESITNTKRYAYVDTSNNILDCPYPSFTDQFFYVSFGLNSTISGLGQVSITNELLQFATIGFQPSYIQYPTNQVLTITNSSSLLNVQEKYINANYFINQPTNGLLQNIFNTNCTINNNNLFCNFSNLQSNGQYNIFSILPTLYSIYSNTQILLATTQKNLYVYSTSTIISITPKATLFGNSINVTITHSTNVFKTNSLLVNFYCSRLESPNSLFFGSITSLTTINCFIPSLYNNYSSLSTLFTSEVTPSNGLLLSNNYFQFYYLNQSLISFQPSSQDLIFYTNTKFTLSIMLNNIIESTLINNLICYIGNTPSSSVVIISTNPIIINCTFTNGNNIAGLNNITLYYSEGTYSFQLSSNYLQIILISNFNLLFKILGTITITSISPTSFSYNNFIDVAISSTFSLSSYNGISYELNCYCK